MNKMIIEATSASDLFKAAALLKDLNLILSFELDDNAVVVENKRALTDSSFSKDESLDKMWDDETTFDERQKEMGNYIDSLDWSRKDEK